MFKNDYQGGPYFEIFTAQGKDAASNWKLIGSSGIKKVFDKEVKGNVYCLEGVAATTKMQLPRDSKQTVVLIQRFLIFQVYITKGQDFSVEIGVTDLGNNKRRLLLSTSQREIQSTPLHAKVPLTILKRGVWLNLCVDLVSLVGDIWRGQTFKAVDSITVSANCRLRRIFTMKLQPVDTTDDDELYGCGMTNHTELDSVPKQCQLALDLLHFTQVITLNKIKHAERLRGTGVAGELSHPTSTLELDLNISGKKPEPYHIAFGTKIAAPISNSRKSTREVNSFQRSARITSSKNDGDPLTSSSSRFGSATSLANSVGDCKRELSANQVFDALLNGDALSGVYEGQGDRIYQPHPPREPSYDKTQRKIRVKKSNQDQSQRGSTGKERVIDEAGRDKKPNSAGRARMQAGKVGRNKQKSSSGASSQFWGGKFNPKENRGTDNAEDKKMVCNPRIPNSSGSWAACQLNISPPHGLQNSGSTIISSPLSTQDKSNEKCQKESHDSSTSNFVDSIVEPSNLQLQESKQNESDVADWHVDDVIDVLRHNLDQFDDENADNVFNDVFKEYEDSDEERPEEVYLFACPPKSAPYRNYSPSQEGEVTQFKKNPVHDLQLKRNKFELQHLSRGAKPEEDFISNLTSSDDDEEEILFLKPSAGSPSCGRKSSSPRTKCRSDINRDVIACNEPANKHSLCPSENGNFNMSTLSRMNRKSLREIPKSDVRLSLAKSSDKLYDFTKYQECTVDSLEAGVLASMKRHHDEEFGGTDQSPRRHFSLSHHHYDESPTATSDEETTTFSSFKFPAARKQVHNYQEEMKYPASRLSTDTLSSSNPRDWSSVFSPPVVLPSDITTNEANKLPMDADSPRQAEGIVSNDAESGKMLQRHQEEEEELDLLYDPVLCCYFDPKTCKYYELV